MIFEAREFTYNNYLFLFLGLPLLITFLMSLISYKRTKLFFNVFFSNKYFYSYPSESPLGVFYGCSMLLILTIFSLTVTFVTSSSATLYTFLIPEYLAYLLWGSVYFILKFLLGNILAYFLNIKKIGKQMLILETSYLASVGVVIFPVLAYGFLHLNNQNFTINFLVISVLFLYCTRLLFLFKNNKNLLSGQILYIILYLCTLEIAPFIYFLNA